MQSSIIYAAHICNILQAIKSVSKKARLASRAGGINLWNVCGGEINYEQTEDSI
jgi:hypothetical protein